MCIYSSLICEFCLGNAAAFCWVIFYLIWFYFILFLFCSSSLLFFHIMFVLRFFSVFSNFLTVKLLQIALHTQNSDPVDI
jgi:hypothetical protein